VSDEDTFEDEQRRTVEALLDRPLAPRELEGFRIVYSRFIDRFGGSRLEELRHIFRTDLQEGRLALAASFQRVADELGSYEEFAAKYPVTIIPPLPAYPLFPVVSLASFQPTVYRVLDTKKLEALDRIHRTGTLLPVAKPQEPVLRAVPRGHFCAYRTWATPDDTRRALQILPEWSDCGARATLAAADLDGLAYVAYTVDPNDPDTRGLAFHGYFYEGLTQDHDDRPYDFPGEAVQICVFGGPPVQLLEEWDPVAERWEVTWTRQLHP
jgi:hypothetical protein